MRLEKTSARRYLCLHLGLLAAVLLFPLYRMLTNQLPRMWIRCVLHDRLFLYCPFCGGTRAVDALLRLDLSAALAANPFVVVLLLLLLILDVIALIRLLRGRKRLLPLPQWSLFFLLAAAIGYAVLRNWLMIAHGYDPIGDLGAFWHH